MSSRGSRSASHISPSTSPTATELIFLGTGTSGAVPVIGCLTSSSTTKCPTCTSTNPRNRRLNTGAVVRIALADGSTKNLLIDCGKTFYSAALQQFPKHGLRAIDALLLTHAHADAFFGLDDLRSWTLPSTATAEPAIQDHVDVYCDAGTMREVERTFPYLVDRRMATGGGDVPRFVWHVFDPYSDGPTTARGDAVGKVNSINGGGPGVQVAEQDDGPGFRVESCGGIKVVPLPVEHGVFMSSGEPFMCMGFRIGGFSYISDCSGVPERTASLMRGSRALVMDGLKWEPHASHFSIQQAREWVRDELGAGKRKERSGNGEQCWSEELGPERTWLVGFSHNVEHENATIECEAWGQTAEAKGMWVRPAWDGLRIGIDGSAL